jgi:hypothetical protein
METYRVIQVWKANELVGWAVEKCTPNRTPRQLPKRYQSNEVARAEADRLNAQETGKD